MVIPKSIHSEDLRFRLPELQAISRQPSSGKPVLKKALQKTLMEPAALC